MASIPENPLALFFNPQSLPQSQIPSLFPIHSPGPPCWAPWNSVLSSFLQMNPSLFYVVLLRTSSLMLPLFPTSPPTVGGLCGWLLLFLHLSTTLFCHLNLLSERIPPLLTSKIFTLSTHKCTSLTRSYTHIFPLKSQMLGLPWWRSGWESTCQCRGHGFEPWSRRIPHAAEQLGPCATSTDAL